MEVQVYPLLLVLFLGIVSAQADQPQDFLLVSWRNSYSGVYKVVPETRQWTKLPLPHASAPLGLDYDPATDRVYWADTTADAITSAQMDGSGYKVHIKVSDTDYIQSLQLDVSENKMYYTRGNEIYVSVLYTGPVVKLADGLTNLFEIQLDLSNRRIFFLQSNPTSQVGEVNFDGSGLNILFKVPATTTRQRGLSFYAPDSALYVCGHRSSSSTYYADYYYYKISNFSSNPQHIGTATNKLCYHIEVDQKYVYVAEDVSNEVTFAPVSNPAAATVITGNPSSGEAYVLSLVQQTEDCRPRFNTRRPVSVQVGEHISGGYQVASFAVSSGAQCRLSGDKEAVSTFSVVTGPGFCNITLSPRYQLAWQKRSLYNVSLQLSGPCRWEVSDSVPIEIEVQPVTGCQQIPESLAAGAVAVEVPVREKLWGRLGVYHMTVTATDSGKPPLASSVPVVVNAVSATSLPGRRRRYAGH